MTLLGELDAQVARAGREVEDPTRAFEPEVRGLAEYCLDTSGKRHFRTAKLPSENSEGRLSQLMADNGVPYRYEEAPGPWKNWLPMVLLTGLFVLLFFTMIKRLGGAGSPMAFGRSRGKQYAQEDLGITFDDVAGIDEAEIGRAHV